MTRARTTGGVWEIIDRLEDARRELYAAEKQANDDMRWWLLLPLLLLCVPLAIGAYVVAFTATHGGGVIGILVGLAFCALFIAAQAWLVRKLLAPRWVGLPRRRTLRREITELERRLDRQRAQEPRAEASGSPLTADEVTDQLESTRRELVELTVAPRGQFRWRYVVAAFLASGMLVPVVLLGIAFPLSTGRFYGLLGVGVPLVALLVWVLMRLARKLDEPRLVVQPRRKQLQRLVVALQQDLCRLQGRAALRRQPSPHAELAWRTVPSFGPAPADMLHRLPASTNRLRLWFHRQIGWGLVAGFVYLAGVVVLYIAVS